MQPCDIVTLHLKKVNGNKYHQWNVSLAYYIFFHSLKTNKINEINKINKKYSYLTH